MALLRLLMLFMHGSMLTAGFMFLAPGACSSRFPGVTAVFAAPPLQN
jgi:hypothetical protein